MLETCVPLRLTLHNANLLSHKFNYLIAFKNNHNILDRDLQGIFFIDLTL